MMAAEVTTFDFEPSTVLHFVSARGWHQAESMKGKLLRFAPTFMLPVVHFVPRLTVSASDTTDFLPAAFVKKAPVASDLAGSALGSLASVPCRSELRGQYHGTANVMFRVAPAVIENAEALVKEGGKAAFYDRMTRKRDESAALGKTLIKLGMCQYVVDVVSVAAAGVLCMPLQTISAMFHHRVLAPINMVVMSHFVASWRLPVVGVGLQAFANLSRLHGTTRAGWKSRHYSSLTETEDHSEWYLSMLNGEDGNIIGGDVDDAREAAMNVLLLIFMLTHMRYSFQLAMIQAVERAFDFIRSNDFGPNSPLSPLLIQAVLDELFFQFDMLRLRIMTFRSPDTSQIRVELLKAFSLLPNLAPNSEIGLITERLRLDDKDTNVSVLLTPRRLAVLSSAAGLKSKDSPVKGDKGKKKAASKNKLGSPVVNPAAGTRTAAAAAIPSATAAAGAVAGSAAGPAVVGSLGHCISFCSMGGCGVARAGRTCRFPHTIPLKASTAYTDIAARLADRGWLPSASFAAAV
jgi:hypothetical protein